MDGFVRLSRRMFSHYLWAEPRVFSRAEAWLDLIQSAAFEDGRRIVKGSVVNVPRGGIVASERFLSDRWRWSRTKVRAFLDLLAVDSMIVLKKDRETTIVNLCNYDTYNVSETGKKPQKSQRGTTEEPLRNQSKEGKERKEEPAKAGSGERPTREAFDAYVVEHLGMTSNDAEHAWNCYEENGWTRSQAGKRIPISNWKGVMNTWKTGFYFPSQKARAPNGQGFSRNVPPTSKPIHERTYEETSL